MKISLLDLHMTSIYAKKHIWFWFGCTFPFSHSSAISMYKQTALLLPHSHFTYKRKTKETPSFCSDGGLVEGSSNAEGGGGDMGASQARAAEMESSASAGLGFHAAAAADSGADAKFRDLRLGGDEEEKKGEGLEEGEKDRDEELKKAGEQDVKTEVEEERGQGDFLKKYVKDEDEQHGKENDTEVKEDEEKGAEEKVEGEGVVDEGEEERDKWKEDKDGRKEGSKGFGDVEEKPEKEVEVGKGEERKWTYYYPQRPNEPDCAFYMKTGKCAYGQKCKFNHPLIRRKNQVQSSDSSDSVQISSGNAVNEKEEEKFPGKVGHLHCKYYLTPAGCKHGSSCKYGHHQERTEAGPVELNFMGLPVRLGERECPFYMRTGSCKYSINCRFHHPDPTAVGGSELHSSCDSSPSHSPALGASASHPPTASWPMQGASNRSVPFKDEPPHYIPQMPVHPPLLPQIHGWNGYQPPVDPLPAPDVRAHPSGANGHMKSTGSHRYQQQRGITELPQRPGQPNCSYYMKNGDCKYRSTCKFNHPKNRFPDLPTCLLSPMGLPLRPGQSICGPYSRNGICKFGPSCIYDHPIELVQSQNVVPGTQ